MSGFSPQEIALIRALNEPLPLTAQPFAEVARRLGVTEDFVLDRVGAWLADGVIRRFGARVSHRKLGFSANGMSVWTVSPEEQDAVAKIMCAQPEVSHCYARPVHPEWPYNLYAMIHGATEAEVEAVARRIAEAAGQTRYRVLFSTRECKKTAPRYFTDPVETTETDA